MSLRALRACLCIILSLAPRAVESDDLPWLSVRPVNKSLNPASLRDFVICDEYGREVTLRGACIEAEQRRCVDLMRSRGRSVGSQPPPEFHALRW